MTKEPRAKLTRYAFGCSDQRPGTVWWLCHAAMVVFILYTLSEVLP